MWLKRRHVATRGGRAHARMLRLFSGSSPADIIPIDSIRKTFSSAKTARCFVVPAYQSEPASMKIHARHLREKPTGASMFRGPDLQPRHQISSTAATTKFTLAKKMNAVLIIGRTNQNQRGWNSLRGVSEKLRPGGGPHEPERFGGAVLGAGAEAW